MTVLRVALAASLVRYEVAPEGCDLVLGAGACACDAAACRRPLAALPARPPAPTRVASATKQPKEDTIDDESDGLCLPFMGTPLIAVVA